jgi:hypothetical protein
MVRRLLLTGLLLVPLAPGLADDAQPISLANAKVLASPGLPGAIRPFLPAGVDPSPLTWPLPAGPLLVLGLVESDPTAFTLGELFDLLPPDGDLHGGYVAAAWHDGNRPLGMILAADAAALAAARFELETAPPAGHGRRPRSVDFQAPDEEGDLWMAAGTRWERPRYRIRALDPRGSLEEATMRCIASRANRIWLDIDRYSDAEIGRALPRLARFGVVPVIATHVNASAARPPPALARLRPWRVERGVTHFALRFDSTFSDRGMNPNHPERPHVESVVDGLRQAGPVDEIVVVPFSPNDALAAEGHAPSPLSDLPEVTLAWSGPHRLPEAVTVEQAVDRVRRAEGAVMFYDTWLEPFSWPTAPSERIPSRPGGRDPNLGDVLEGIVVVGGPGTSAALEAAWGGNETPREEWREVLLPLLPRGESNVEAFLKETAAALRREDERVLGTLPWILPLAATLERDAAGRLGASPLAVPRVPASIAVDGRLDDRSWAYAASRAASVVGEGTPTHVRLLALADERRLCIAVRMEGSPARLSFRLADALGGVTSVGCLGDDLTVTCEAGAEHVAVAHRSEDGVTTVEIAIGPAALGGDAYPTRVFRASIEVGDVELLGDALVLVP